MIIKDFFYKIKNKIKKNGQTVREYEIIYNSITVVHAPRHPIAGPPSSSNS